MGTARKVDIRLPGKEDSNSHGARPVHKIILWIKWIRTSTLSMEKSLLYGYDPFVHQQIMGMTDNRAARER